MPMNATILRRALATLAPALLLAAGCSRQPQPPVTPAGVPTAQAADTLYVGGNIVTINRAQPTAEALAVKDGRILAVGPRAELEAAHKGEATQVVDLGGKALLPAFLDAHSHYVSALSAAGQAKVLT